MGLEALLATLERRAAVTPVTSGEMVGVTRKPAPALACTAVTCVTAANDVAALATATREQETELRGLLALILANDSDVDRAEALRRAANDAAPDPAGAHRRWSIQCSGLRVGEAIFHPEVTRDEAIAAFPGSIAATPLPETPIRPPTQAEREEMIQLIDTVLPGDPEGQYEALTIALADVDNALVCFRRLAGSSDTSDHDPS